MLSLEEISDRLEIQQLLVDYSTAIDNRQFDDLDRVFTADAHIDYTELGGIAGTFPDVKAWLAEVLPNFPAYFHMLGNFDIRIEGTPRPRARSCSIRWRSATTARSCSADSGTTTRSSGLPTAGG